MKAPKDTDKWRSLIRRLTLAQEKPALCFLWRLSKIYPVESRLFEKLYEFVM